MRLPPCYDDRRNPDFAFLKKKTDVPFCPSLCVPNNYRSICDSSTAFNKSIPRALLRQTTTLRGGRCKIPNSNNSNLDLESMACLPESSLANVGGKVLELSFSFAPVF